MKLLNFLYGITGLVVFLILVWLFAVPNELIQQKMEDAVSRSGDGNMALSVEGIRKGVFFSLSADTVKLSIDNKPALSINDLSINFTPRHLNSGKLAFLVSGKIGTGTVKGILKLPMKGSFKIDKAGLFNIPDLNIGNPDVTVIPLINTFRRMQGSVHLDGNNLQINSISLEGEKGFARLKGQIRNGVADITLELMPVERSLNTLESMLIGKYIVSPGYYVVPINGPLPIQ